MSILLRFHLIMHLTVLCESSINNNISIVMYYNTKFQMYQDFEIQTLLFNSAIEMGTSILFL